MPPRGYKKQFCKNGHDKTVVGTRPNGWCLECAKPRRSELEKKRREKGVHREVNYRNPICPAGHDKRIVGSEANGGCYECRKLSSREYGLKTRRLAAGLPEGLAIDAAPVRNLRHVRLTAGLTQAEMARRIGVNNKHYRELEATKKRGSRRTIARILGVFDDLRHKRGPAYERGNLARLAWALDEAERRGEPYARTVYELGFSGRDGFERPQSIGPLLRWARTYGYAERFENVRGVSWLLTDEGRRLLGQTGRAA